MFSAARRQVLIDATWWALIPGAVVFLVLQVYVHVQGDMVGVDSHAYWLAAREPATSVPTSCRGTGTPYLYSPVFAQLLWVFGKLPWPMFSALWMAVHVGLLGWLLAPLGWRRGLTLGAFFVTEILLGNVYLLFAMSLVLMVRGRGSVLLVPLLTKVVPAVIGLWYLPRREVRPMVEALVSTLVVVGVSVAISPGAWIDWLHLPESSLWNRAGTLGPRAPCPRRSHARAVPRREPGEPGCWRRRCCSRSRSSTASVPSPSSLRSPGCLSWPSATGRLQGSRTGERPRPRRTPTAGVGCVA